MMKNGGRSASRWTSVLFSALFLAAGMHGAAVQAQSRPARPPVAAPRPDPQSAPSTEREWFMSFADTTLDLWSAELPANAKGVSRLFVGLVTAGCQGPGGANWYSGSYKVVFDEFAGSPRLQASPGSPTLQLATVRGRVSLSYVRPTGASISCIVRASKPYGVDNANAGVELTDFRYGK
ncbi:hypothetical protein CFHF_04085 [Caulobacter flavus]|uniref:Uncharacterized protein n=1 Tax=Caulobacter flavus TaxID=1679497 RepID=A0A2N5CZK9_9CAUL|nr:hypothetical protein [Caulobacter flavus]AYV45124.1 hypothetical protein C1707_02085 [Caulobacter flavus]PLR19196.1 hypothetical protein CFHF_04085 [Caulobacter flavus]